MTVLEYAQVTAGSCMQNLNQQPMTLLTSKPNTKNIYFENFSLDVKKCSKCINFEIIQEGAEI